MFFDLVKKQRVIVSGIVIVIVIVSVRTDTKKLKKGARGKRFGVALKRKKVE